MKKLLLCLLLMSSVVSSDFDPTAPLFIVADKNGAPIATLAGFPTESEAIIAASELPDDQYLIFRVTPTKRITFEKLTMVLVDIPSGTASLSWTAPTKNTDESDLIDLAGYKIYYGSSESNLNKVVEVGLVTQFDVENLTENDRYFAVVAVNDQGDQSELSKVVSKKVL